MFAVFGYLFLRILVKKSAKVRTGYHHTFVFAFGAHLKQSQLLYSLFRNLRENCVRCSCLIRPEAEVGAGGISCSCMSYGYSGRGLAFEHRKLLRILWVLKQAEILHFYFRYIIVFIIKFRENGHNSHSFR